MAEKKAAAKKAGRPKKTATPKAEEVETEVETEVEDTGFEAGALLEEANAAGMWRDQARSN